MPSVLRLQEVALIGMLAYLSYLCGELLGISGIVSLFCCGVVTSHYVRPARPPAYALLTEPYGALSLDSDTCCTVARSRS